MYGVRVYVIVVHLMFSDKKCFQWSKVNTLIEYDESIMVRCCIVVTDRFLLTNLEELPLSCDIYYNILKWE